MLIPTRPEDLTPDWLTAVLRRQGVLRSAAVTDASLSPLEEDKGFFSRISRVRLDYDKDEGDIPRALIVKLSASAPEMRQRPNTVAAYEREVRFYQQMAHRMSLPTPTCYYADIDAETGYHVLLLEDLAPARNGSRIVGCTPAQAEIAVRQIATLHADWWESSRLARFDWLRDQQFEHAALVKAHQEWWPEFLRRAGHQVPDSLISVGERLGHHRAAMFRHLWTTPPRTLTHSDYQLDNLLFSSPEGGIPFAVIDWQSIGRRRGIWDIALFLGQNLDPEFRSAVEMDLLAEYLQILDHNGVRNYDLDQCFYDYKLCLLQRFGALISTIAAMPFTEEQIRMHIDVLLPRNIRAILDHDAASLIA